MGRQHDGEVVLGEVEAARVVYAVAARAVHRDGDAVVDKSIVAIYHMDCDVGRVTNVSNCLSTVLLFCF